MTAKGRIPIADKKTLDAVHDKIGNAGDSGTNSVFAKLNTAANTLANHVAAWTAARASKIDNLDTTISSRAPANTALSNLVWTNAKASYIDMLPLTQDYAREAKLGTDNNANMLNHVSAAIGGVNTNIDTLDKKVAAVNTNAVSAVESAVKAKVNAENAYNKANEAKTSADNAANQALAGLNILQNGTYGLDAINRRINGMQTNGVVVNCFVGYATTVQSEGKGELYLISLNSRDINVNLNIDRTGNMSIWKPPLPGVTFARFKFMHHFVFGAFTGPDTSFTNINQSVLYYVIYYN